MTTTRVIGVLWFILAGVTLTLIYMSDSSRLLLALAAWCGGLVTQEMGDRIVTRHRGRQGMGKHE